MLQYSKFYTVLPLLCSMLQISHQHKSTSQRRSCTQCAYLFFCYASALVSLLLVLASPVKLATVKESSIKAKSTKIFFVHFVYFGFEAFLKMFTKFTAFVAGNVAWSSRIRSVMHALTKFPPVSGTQYLHLLPTELYYITGGSARGKKVSSKTWRISAFADARLTPYGSSGSWYLPLTRLIFEVGSTFTPPWF